MKYEKSLLEEALYHWNSTENEEKRLRKWIQSMEEEAEKSKAWDKLVSEDSRVNELSKLKGLDKQATLAAKVISSSLIIKEYKEGGFKNE